MYSLDDDQAKSFEELGFAGPFDLLDVPQAIFSTSVLSHAKSRMFFWHRMLSRMPVVSGCFPISRWGAAKWHKGLHAVNGEAYRLGADRRIVERVRQILGPDVLLCGSMLINQRPGTSHIWHCDIEHGDWNGLTVWVALRNVSEKSTLRVISRSQSIPSPPPASQNSEFVLAEAQRHDPACRELALPAKPGQFYILASQLWHSSWNEASETRYAILFQYCATDVQVRWPVRALMHKTRLPIKVAYRVPCYLVSGEDHHRENLLVNAPDRRA